jgi:hypothetical protein
VQDRAPPSTACTSFAGHAMVQRVIIFRVRVFFTKKGYHVSWLGPCDLLVPSGDASILPPPTSLQRRLPQHLHLALSQLPLRSLICTPRCHAGVRATLLLSLCGPRGRVTHRFVPLALPTPYCFVLPYHLFKTRRSPVCPVFSRHDIIS